MCQKLKQFLLLNLFILHFIIHFFVLYTIGNLQIGIYKLKEYMNCINVKRNNFV